MGVDRRQFLNFLTTGVAMAGAGELTAEAAAPTARDKRPNFLVLFCDDMTYRTIGGLNNPEVKTPHLDRLVKEGTSFTHAFHQGSWQGAVCVASRTMAHTGLSCFHARDLTQKVAHFTDYNLQDMQTWGQVLGMAGYNTYISGKWHLDATLLPRSFQKMGPVGPGMLPSTGAHGDMYNRPAPGNHWNPADETRAGHWMHTSVWDSTKEDRIEHSSTLYTDHAVDYLKDAAHESAPFFAYVAFNAPHDPRQAPQEFLDMYPVDKVQVPPNFLPEHPFDQGDYKLRDEILAPFPRTKEAVQVHRREYYAIISHLDQQVGRILKALDESGRAENTYVIFTGDHGLAVGEHGLLGKQNMYDCSLRMPMIVRGPGVKAGRKCDELIYQHSLFATTCDVAGVAVPKTVEFPSIKKLWMGADEPVLDSVFCNYKEFQRAVRSKTHKLIVYPQVGVVQLFDMVNDPWEKKNLADDPKMAGLKKKLWARLEAYQKELGDTLPLDHPSTPEVPDALYHD